MTVGSDPPVGSVYATIRSHDSHSSQRARLSTGPRTEAGKAISSRNARTHGLCSQDLIVQPHEQPEFEELLQIHRADLQPQGVLEQTQFDLIVHATWNLRRIRRLEADLCRGLDPLAALDDEALQRKLDRLGRHHTRFECSLARSIRSLKKLQTERSQPAPPQPQPARMSTSELIAAVARMPGLRIDRNQLARACGTNPTCRQKLEAWLANPAGPKPAIPGL